MPERHRGLFFDTRPGASDRRGVDSTLTGGPRPLYVAEGRIGSFPGVEEKMRVGVISAVASVFVAAVLGASSAPAAYDSAELKCRSSVAKSFTKAVASGQKTISVCHKGRGSGKVGAPIDCNLLDNLNADDKGKFAKASAKLTASVQKSCIDSGIDSDVLTEYTSCPEPCATELALPNPLGTYTQLSSCLACLARDISENFGLDTQGLPAGVPLAGADQACHSAIGKGYGKLLKTILKDRTKCQNSEEKDGAEHLSETACLTSDPKGKIALLLGKAEDGIDTSCAGATLANLDSCTALSVTDLKTCLGTETDSSGDDGVQYSYVMAATICPVAITTRTVAGAPMIGPPFGATRLESGWNGIGHGQDIVHGYATSVAVTCPNSSPPCGDCTIDGIDPAGTQTTAFTRCKQDATIPCSNPFGIDGVCPGTQECSYYLGPPGPLSASNTPTCGLFRLENDITGTLDPDSGEGEQNVVLRAVIHTGIALNKPCPICVDDTTAQDGIQDGVCDGGTRDGLGCDVQGFDATFAPGEGVSLDCTPAALQNITGQGLLLDLSLASGSSSLPFALACDFPLNAFACACAVCTGDASQACNSDAECAATLTGTCTSSGGGTPRQPNACSDLTCTDVGGGVGECDAGPDVMACDGALRANGDSFVLCSDDSECEVGAIGFDAGACTQVLPRACFLDPITSVGAPDPDQTVLVSTFCVPPTSSSGVNAATGLPGPSRTEVELGIERQY